MDTYTESIPWTSEICDQVVKILEFEAARNSGISFRLGEGVEVTTYTEDGQRDEEKLVPLYTPRYVQVNYGQYNVRQVIFCY